MLKKYRKDLRLDTKELDEFLGSKSVSTKYYIENSYQSNMLFKYLIYLRKKGVDLNNFFDEESKCKGEFVSLLEAQEDFRNKIYGSQNKVGRPDRPEEESILKTHKVRIELLNTTKNVDDVCKEFNIAKSTYYRVAKWIAKQDLT